MAEKKSDKDLAPDQQNNADHGAPLAGVRTQQPEVNPLLGALPAQSGGAPAATGEAVAPSKPPEKPSGGMEVKRKDRSRSVSRSRRSPSRTARSRSRPRRSPSPSRRSLSRKRRSDTPSRRSPRRTRRAMSRSGSRDRSRKADSRGGRGTA